MWSQLARVCEVRFAFCQRSAASSGIRSFLKSEYMSMKAQNPRLPILVRECQDTLPRMTVRYDFGREESLICDGLDQSQIRERLAAMASQQQQLGTDTKATSSSFLGR